MTDQALLLVVNLQDHGDSDPEWDAVVNRIDTLIRVFQQHEQAVAFAQLSGQSSERQRVSLLQRYAVPRFELRGLSVFFNPHFSRFIDRHRINTVYVCGAGIHTCVLKAVLDSEDWDLSMQRPVLLQDACYEEPAWRHLGQAALSVLSAHNIEISDTQAVIREVTCSTNLNRRLGAVS